ncbi:hypothetical protein ACLB1O_17345 [Escherichia coli]
MGGDSGGRLGIAAGHWLPGIVPVNAVLGGALSYLIRLPYFES